MDNEKLSYIEIFTSRIYFFQHVNYVYTYKKCF